MTVRADEFGGPSPSGGFALIGDEEIGKVGVESIGDSPVVLLKNHGVFTVGRSAEVAVKSAVMVEDLAHTAWIALQLGQPQTIPENASAKRHHHYQSVYSQC